MSLEQLRFDAYKNGNDEEVKRLDRLIERLEDQKRSYGKAMRGEQL